MAARRVCPYNHAVPPDISSLTHRARASTRAAALAGITLGLLGAQAAHASLRPAEERKAVFQRYMRHWARALLHAFGCQLHVTGSVPPRDGRGRLILSNHRSPLDIAILLGLYGGCAVSRDDLAEWPVLGVAAREAGTIFVDRADAGSGASAIRAIRARLKQGDSVLIFPEGGTFEGDTVAPFKEGAFVALRGLDVDVVPVGLAYDPGVEFLDETFAQHMARVAGRPHTRCAVRLGQPCAPEGGASRIAREMHGKVQQLVVEARQDWHRWQTP